MGTKIFYGVPVYVMNDRPKVYDALVSVNGIVDFFGSFEEAIRLYPDAERIKFENGCIVPGFIDAHLSIESLFYYYKDGLLEGISDVKELLESIESVIKSKKGNDLFVFGGVDRQLIRSINRDVLDPVSLEKPVVLFSDDLQIATCNSTALGLLSINTDRKDPYLGKIVRDSNSNPTGLLLGRAVDLVRKYVLSQKLIGITFKTQKIISILSSLGITGVCNFGLNPGSIYRNIYRLSEAGQSSVRYVLMYGYEDSLTLTSLGLGSGFGNDRICIGGCYFEIDGSIENQTAYLRRKYRDTGARGILMYDEDTLKREVKKMYSKGMWVSIGCSGDKACEIGITVFDNIQSKSKRKNHFFRLDNPCVLEDGDMDNIARLNIAVVLSPGRAIRERMFVIRAMGKDAGKAFRLRSLLSRGIRVGFGSWSPLLSLNPLYHIYSAVERKLPGEGPELRFYPRERVEVEQALYCATRGAAFTCGIEDFTGSLLKGTHADFVHLSEDIFKCDTDKLLDTTVLSTYISGENVYEKKMIK